MRFLLKNISLYALSLFSLEILFSGVSIRGGTMTYVIGGILLTLFFYTLKPLLQLFTLPLQFATFGLFTVIVNAFILYILTVLVPNITITDFTFQGFSLLGFIIPKITFNAFFAYILCAVVISCLTTFINWLFE